jgi:hypothetical protein
VLIAIIVACEIGFWVVLGASLLVRYVFGLRRLSAFLLICVPLVDVVLLVATVIDLGRGGTAELGHGLAAAYIGFSVAFGHSMIRWADQRFAHWFASGPPPWRPPRGGRERTRYEWREFGKAAVAWTISCALLATAILVIDDIERTSALVGWIAWLSMVLGIWSLWPITCTFWPGRAEDESRA